MTTSDIGVLALSSAAMNDVVYVTPTRQPRDLANGVIWDVVSVKKI